MGHVSARVRGRHRHRRRGRVRRIARASFARKYGVASAYGSYAEMVASPDVDIVYVGTINRLHKEHSILAIEAGKHVLCEKQLAETGADGRAMYAAAQAHGVMLQDAVWTRFFPAVEHARMLIEAGAIGEVVLVQSDFGDPIYTVQAAPLAFGSDATPTAVTVAGRRPGGAIVEYGPDRCAVLTFPARPSEFVETTEIVGREGRITLEQPAHAPTTITLRIPPRGTVPSRYRTDNVPAPVQRFRVPVAGGGEFSRSGPIRTSKGSCTRAEAVHRCLAGRPAAVSAIRQAGVPARPRHRGRYQRPPRGGLTALCGTHSAHSLCSGAV